MTAVLPFNVLSSRVRGRVCGLSGECRVVAAARIRQGCVVVVFGGRLHRGSMAHETSLQPFPLRVDEDAFLVPVEDSPASWIGRSCEPSAGLLGAVSLVALRTIEPGQTISFDYGNGTVLGSSAAAFDCNCGSVLCRGRVSGDDWRRPDMRARYDGHFSPYLVRRMQAVLGGGSSGLSRGRVDCPTTRGRPLNAGIVPLF